MNSNDNQGATTSTLTDILQESEDMRRMTSDKDLAASEPTFLTQKDVVRLTQLSRHVVKRLMTDGTIECYLLHGKLVTTPYHLKRFQLAVRDARVHVAGVLEPYRPTSVRARELPDDVVSKLTRARRQRSAK